MKKIHEFKILDSYGAYKYVVHWNYGGPQRPKVREWATEQGIACSVIEYNDLLLFYVNEISLAEWFVMTWA